MIFYIKKMISVLEPLGYSWHIFVILSLFLRSNRDSLTSLR